MRNEIMLSCGCRIIFSDTNNALIVNYECEKHREGIRHSNLHFIISEINNLLITAGEA